MNSTSSVHKFLANWSTDVWKYLLANVSHERSWLTMMNRVDHFNMNKNLLSVATFLWYTSDSSMDWKRCAKKGWRNFSTTLSGMRCSSNVCVCVCVVQGLHDMLKVFTREKLLLSALFFKYLILKTLPSAVISIMVQRTFYGSRLTEFQLKCIKCQGTRPFMESEAEFKCFNEIFQHSRDSHQNLFYKQAQFNVIKRLLRLKSSSNGIHSR